MKWMLSGAVGAVLALVILLWLVYRLRRSEERFRMMAENASDLLGMHTQDGTWLWVSPSIERILGYKPEEIIGHNSYEFFHPDDKERIERESHSVVLDQKTGSDVVISYRMRHKEGFYIWLETLTEPIFDKNGCIVQLRTASRDVTGRKEAEYLYRFLIRNLPQTSVLLFDREFRHIVAEGNLLHTTITPQGGLEGRTLREVFPNDIALTLTPFYMSVLRDIPVRKELIFRTRTYDAHFLPVHDSTGIVRAGMAVFSDITEEVSRIRILEERGMDLERSNRDLEQFANVASHELKSPLRRIAGFAEILAEDYEGLLSDDADEYLGHILEGVTTLQAVIESLLVYSGVQAEKTRMVWLVPEEVLKKALAHLSPLIRERKAKVYSGPLPEAVTGDGTLLRQLLENLIGNAIKFNTESEAPMVRVTCIRTLMEWEFAVEDNGPGLDLSYQDKVFMMFQRIHPEVEGTGIGLALCKKIVGIHRGKIWFEPSVGGGTVFKFTIPARSPEEVTNPGPGS